MKFESYTNISNLISLINYYMNFAYFGKQVFQENDVCEIFDRQMTTMLQTTFVRWHSFVPIRITVVEARYTQHEWDARNGMAGRLEGRKAGTLSGVRGHSNFTRGLTLRRMECALPPFSSSSGFLSFLPRSRFYHRLPAESLATRIPRSTLCSR